jgi:hypothetical protein
MRQRNSSFFRARFIAAVLFASATCRHHAGECETGNHCPDQIAMRAMQTRRAVASSRSFGEKFKANGNKL